MIRPRPAVAAGLVVLGMAFQTSAQPAAARPEGAAVVFLGVNLIRMDRERVETRQTVITRGGRITAIGPRSTLRVPDDAVVIDGRGRYLTPGLTDAHVHLEGGGTGSPGATRPDFGDAPLYLANGVTTVFNLGGTPVQLDWRRRIENAELVGPTIYTSGRFVNEPRAHSPEAGEVRDEISAQARDGYDLISFHETGPGANRPGARVGLSLPAYLAMHDAAREAGLPLLGHAPASPGLDALLRGRRPPAPSRTPANPHSLLAAGDARLFQLTAVALGTLIVVLVTGSIGAAVARRTRQPAPQPPSMSHLRALTGWVLAASLAAAGCAALFLPGGPRFDSLALRLVFTVLAVFIAAATVVLPLMATGVWRDWRTSRFARLQATLASLAGLAVAYATLTFWVPVAWRTGDLGIERLAAQAADAGIWVRTTALPYDLMGGSGRPAPGGDPAASSPGTDVRATRRPMPRPMPRSRDTGFTAEVVGAFHEAGAPPIPATDAKESPLVPPGASLHRELQELVEAGLTPYEAMRAATVVPAGFLGRENEFGAIAVGTRADLLLLAGNPLDDIGHLRTPVGVMARGTWFSRSQLERLLGARTVG